MQYNPSNFDVCDTTQNTQSFNFKLNLNVCISVCLLVLLLRYWSSFAVAFLAIKVKRYVHVSSK